jgi:hypothetical protein
VVELLPFNASGEHALVRDLVVSVLELGVLLGGELSKLDHLIVQLFGALLSDDAILVHAGNSRELYLTIHSTSVHDLLHDVALSRVTVALTNEISSGNLGVWLARCVILAAVAFSLSLVRSTILLNHVGLFANKSVKYRPTSITAFVHVIAHHGLLRRHLRHWLTVFQLKLVLNDLDKTESVARTTMTLVTELS